LRSLGRTDDDSDIYEFEFGVIASSRTVVSSLVHRLTFSAGPQRELTAQVDVLAFAGVARCGRWASHHFRAACWSHRSAVLQVLAIRSNSSALAGRHFRSLRRQDKTNSSTSRGICNTERCDGVLIEPAEQARHDGVKDLVSVLGQI